MDRRSFLKFAGVSGVLAVAVPQVVLAATTKVALPERRVFLPPADGWRSMRAEWQALNRGPRASGLLELRPISEDRIARVLGAYQRAVGFDGGYLVPADFAEELMRLLGELERGCRAA